MHRRLLRRSTLLVLGCSLLALVGGCATTARSSAVHMTTGPSASAVSSGGSTCRPSQFDASLGQAPAISDASASTGIYLTNTSTRPCTMSGYVTLSFLDGPHGQTFGRPARPDPSKTFGTTTVTIAPDGRAAIIFSRLPGRQGCTAEPLWGYRLLLPGGGAPIDVDDGPETSSTCVSDTMIVAPVQDADTL